MKIKARQLTEVEKMLVCRALRSWEAGDTQDDHRKEALVSAIVDGELVVVTQSSR